VPAHAGSAALSPNGKAIVGYMRDGTVRLWELSSGQLRFAVRNELNCLTSATFSPDSRALAMVAGDRTIEVRDVNTGTVRFRIGPQCHSRGPAAFSPRGRALAAVGEDGALRAWDVAKGASLFSVAAFKQGAFSRNGHSLLAAFGDRSLCVVDTVTGRAKVRLSGEAYSFTSAEFSPGSRTLATLSADGVLRLWESASGRLRSQLKIASHRGLAVSLSWNDSGSLWEADDTALRCDLVIQR
jgi:WD40 repeat protein